MKREEMIQEVSQHFGIRPEEVRSMRRELKVVMAKKVVCYVLRMYGMSFPQIGRVINKDHQTVLHAVQTIPEELRLYAEGIFNKYTKLDEIDNFEKERKQTFSVKAKLIELLNKGKTAEEIAEETNINLELVQEYINFFLTNGWYKKVPNYHTGGINLWFYDKNKKC